MNKYYEIFKPKKSTKKQYIYEKKYKKNSVTLQRSKKENKALVDYFSSIVLKSLNFTKADFSFVSNIIIREIKFCLKKKYKINKISNIYFVVGLGNNEVCADKLGTSVCNKIISTNYNLQNNLIDKKLFSNVFSLAPSITKQNGISTSLLIKTISDEFRPDIVFVIDSMCCKNLNYLFNTIQISTSGLTPGSIEKTSQRKISSNFLNIPVISIGCPLVFNLKDITNKQENIILTSIEIEEITKKYANLIAYSLNRLLHNKLTKKEVEFLTFDHLF